MIVTDASALTTALVDRGSPGFRARAALDGQSVAAPDLIDLEIVSAVRGLLRGGVITPTQATAALDVLTSMPLARKPHRTLVRRCWELRDNLTPYDASYVALAELLEVTLVTADDRLARAPGLRCQVEVLV